MPYDHMGLLGEAGFSGPFFLIGLVFVHPLMFLLFAFSFAFLVWLLVLPFWMFEEVDDDDDDDDDGEYIGLDEETVKKALTLIPRLVHNAPTLSQHNKG